MAYQTQTDLARLAQAYLARQLGLRAPSHLSLVATLAEQPLAGEGPVAIFSFELPHRTSAAANAAPPDPRHYVVVGTTEPNYFPAHGLPPDDAYSLHVGTRLALELGLEVVDTDTEPPEARRAMRAFVAACNPDAPIERESLAGLFRCEDRLFAVYRVTLRGHDVYCLGADCPPGFCDQADLPPQVALRVHLGRVIRAEARREARRPTLHAGQ